MGDVDVLRAWLDVVRGELGAARLEAAAGELLRNGTRAPVQGMTLAD